MSYVTLEAGVSRIDITPPVGFRMQGAMRRIEPSVGVESPLFARALVIADENNKVVIFDCDLIESARQASRNTPQSCDCGMHAHSQWPLHSAWFLGWSP